jgi:F0F1-type ATP synthase alpha subunit
MSARDPQNALVEQISDGLLNILTTQGVQPIIAITGAVSIVGTSLQITLHESVSSEVPQERLDALANGILDQIEALLDEIPGLERVNSQDKAEA